MKNHNALGKLATSSAYRDVRPIAIDLFAGAGGMSLGFEQARFDVVAAVDADPLHCATHEHNFPTTATICRDIRSTDVSHVQVAVEQGLALHGRTDNTRAVNVVMGGPPCQGFSVGGLRDLADERNDLVLHFARMVASIQPRYFVMENVPGLAGRAHWRLLENATARLERAGYTVEESIIFDASDLGIPQARRRLVMTGYRRGQKPVRLVPMRRSAVTGKFQVLRKTMSKRRRNKLRALGRELKRRRQLPIPEQGRWLRRVVQGHINYYAVPGNFKAVAGFVYELKRRWQRTLQRRSQKSRMPWQRLEPLAERWLPHARIVHPYPFQRFAVLHPR